MRVLKVGGRMGEDEKDKQEVRGEVDVSKKKGLEVERKLE